MSGLGGKLRWALSLLYIHGILSEAEKDRARRRLAKWLAENEPGELLPSDPDPKKRIYR